MRPEPVYLDNNATAPIRPEAQAAAVCALDIGANPSSVHARGRTARAAVEQAREQVAGLVSVSPDQVLFTSGGTEANRMAVEGAIAHGCRRPIVLSGEHDSTLRAASASGLWVEACPVDGRGLADLDWLADRLKRWDTADGAPFVALSLANSETGVIQPAAEAAALVHAAGGAIHVDAVQAAGKIAIDFKALGADTLSLSGHKLGAPQGVGALVAQPRARLSPRVPQPGGQERGLRTGTENVSGIAGFGAAAAVARIEAAEDRFAPMAAWRDAAAAVMAEEGAVIAGESAPRLPNVLCAATDGFASELQVMMLDLEGVMVSAGSACSSGKVTSSPVLAAMGMLGLAGFGLRASAGWATTEADWTRFAQAWREVHRRHQKRRKVA